MFEITERLKNDPSIEIVLSVNGVSAINRALQPNAGLVIAKLKPWSERTTPESAQTALQKKYQAEFSQMPQCKVIVFGAPTIPSLGVIAGNAFVVEDTASQGADKLSEVTNQIITESTVRPEITSVLSTYEPGAPQIEIEIDRVKAKTLGVVISDVFTVADSARRNVCQ